MTQNKLNDTICLNIYPERLMQINLKDRRKKVLATFLINKKKIFEYLCVQCFDVWLFYASEGLRSQLKFCCLR